MTTRWVGGLPVIQSDERLSKWVATLVVAGILGLAGLFAYILLVPEDHGRHPQKIEQKR